MTANIARTASRALANAVLPTLKDVVRKGLSGALRDDPCLAAGLYLYEGRMVNEKVGGILHIPAVPLQRLLDRSEAR